MSHFWLTLGLLLFGYLIFGMIKYFLLYMTILYSNQAIHEDMIHGLVRSPSSYFDMTSTGRLNNKFSNDLGILDSSLQFVLIDAIEGSIVIIILVINVFSINYYFIIPGAINIAVVIFFFMYCKKAIIKIKQLDLKLKTPLFDMARETLSGLIGIKIYNRRLGSLK
jgi:ABC-type multidrug transport system fused ATPase/permease subunit